MLVLFTVSDELPATTNAAEGVPSNVKVPVVGLESVTFPFNETELPIVMEEPLSCRVPARADQACRCRWGR